MKGGVPAYLAIDLGASSGRAVVGTLDDGVMRMHEVRRFPTRLIEERGHLYWDLDALWAEIRGSLAAAFELAPSLRAISVDSWGVDYVPLDEQGTPVRRPYAYRDPRTRGRLDRVLEHLGRDAIYDRTGIQFLDINTLPQVIADVEDEPALVSRTATRLLIADYILYALSGIAIAERTLASTTQLLDVRTGDWSHELIRAIGDAPARWPRIVEPGTVLGPLIGDLTPAGSEPPLVIAGCSHDTAAAVAAVPSSGDRPWAYISSGTWSLVGVERTEPLLTAAARLAGFTNEAGVDGTIRLLKNRTGMWVVEECVREWSASCDHMDVGRLLTNAAHEPPYADTIELDTPAFSERGDMPAKIAAACRERGLAPPGSRAAAVRLIVDSLADVYRRTISEVEALTGESIEVIHLVGGGSRNAMLNQLTADACGRPVISGPDEATSLGSLLVQARAVGDLPGGEPLRHAARRSTRVDYFTPRAVSPDRRVPILRV